MSVNLKGRSFLTLKDFSPEEIDYLIDLSLELKQKKCKGIKERLLKGKNIALIFEKPSTRTRCAFVVAAFDEGAHPEYLGKGDIQLGKKESVKDTARVLGRMFDGIQFRGFKHETVEALAEYAGVPVWNGLTDRFHPTQTLADFLTVKEHKGDLKGIKFAYVGDGRNNVANSLLIGSAKIGVDFRIVSPKELFPSRELLAYTEETSRASGATITVTDDVDRGVDAADVIYTDVWVSMGEEEQFKERIKLLKPYQVNIDMMKKASDSAIFLHCLPAFHNRETMVGEETFQKYGLGEMEVTEEVFESKQSVVFDQAENRVHTIKAVMVATLSG
ncbi:ornithine carbamoyltransferase [Fibrobacterota bacterium]